MKNTHGHDEQGNPVRGPLPGARQEQAQQQLDQLRQERQPQQSSTETTNVMDLQIMVQSNLTHTKAALHQLDILNQNVTEIKNQITKLLEKVEYNTQVDTEKLVGQLQTISDTVAPFLKAELKSASQLYDDDDEGKTKTVKRPKAYSDDSPPGPGSLPQD